MHKVNSLPIRDMSQSTTDCCPPFQPAEWDGQTFTFDRKLFIKFTTRSLFHIPLNMSGALRTIMARIEDAGAASSDHLMLSDEVSPWKAEHYIAVTKAVPQAEMVHLSGTFLTKVFEGPYKDMGQWHEELIAYARTRSQEAVKTYFNYALCPRCAKAYGHNYVVGFAQV